MPELEPAAEPQKKRPLWQQRRDFSRHLADLIWWADTMNVADVVLNEVLRPPQLAEIYAQEGVGIRNSLHLQGLAGDLMVFIDGVYQKDHDAYAILGRRWKEMDPRNRWGGDFKRDDADHFERTPE